VEGLSKFHVWIIKKLDGKWQVPIPAGEPIDHPDDFYTYVGIGQVIDSEEGEIISYNYTLNKAKEVKDILPLIS